MAYSPAFLSKVTYRVFAEIEQWRNRPLEEQYFAIYLDAIHYKVRENRKVVTKAVYSVYGVNMEGNGMCWVCSSGRRKAHAIGPVCWRTSGTAG